MRVLFSSTGGEGHVQPMLPLAAALRDQGHQVLWAAPPEAHERVAAAGLEVRRSGRGVAWCGGEYARRWPEALHLPVEEATVHMYPRLFGAVAAPAAYPDLLEVARGFGPDLVVHEAAEYAAPAVAASLGVPSVAHGIGLGIRSALVEEACAFASTSTPTTWVDLCPPSLRPPDIPAPAGALPMRAATLERIPDEVLPEAVAQALTDAGDRPVVHVTFGTVYANPADLRRTAEAIAALGVLVIVSGRLDAAVPGVVVADYAPYSLLLRRCRAVVSQAGAGVMLKTLAAGVPQLCLPKAATDQFRNAAACEAAGAGLRLVGDAATPEAVAGATSRLIEDASFAEAARGVAVEIAAMPSPADVARTLARGVGNDLAL